MRCSLACLAAVLAHAVAAAAASPLLSLSVSSAEDQCEGAGSQRYDVGVGEDYVPWNIRTGSDMYSGTAAQLFVVPSVPWKYTRLCFAMRLRPEGNTSVALQATVRGEVSLYPVSVFSGKMIPGDRTAVAAFSKDIAYTPPAAGTNKTSNNGVYPVWLSVDVSSNAQMVAWSKGVFVAVNWWSCKTVQLVGMMTSYGRRRLALKYNSLWEDASRDAWLIRTTGHNHSGLPPGWYCNRTYYNDRICDCNCGAPDPDCNAKFTGCGTGNVCDQAGRCVELDWSKKGKCKTSNYWQYDGCQCECGSVIDPDCLDDTAPANVCTSVNVTYGKCHDDYYDGSYCTDVWRCNASLYNDGKVCNCRCGLPDPDCDNHSLNTTCPGNWLCINDKCFSPREWKCEPRWYDYKDECDCGCGKYDPDCDDESQQVLNCASGQTCNYLGVCVDTGCGNHRAEGSRGEQCDGGTGCSNATCRCLSGYHPRSPLRESCQTQCGDLIVAGYEECDGGLNCAGNCKCNSGFKPYSPVQQFCTGCGNKVLDTELNESCDSGLGCDLTCRLPKESKSSRTKVIISSTVGSVGGFLLLVAVVAAIIYARKVKYGPRKLNIPVELDGGISTADVNCVPVADQSIPYSGTQMATFVSSDGLVYMSTNQAIASSSSNSSGRLGGVVPSPLSVQLQDLSMAPVSIAYQATMSPLNPSLSDHSSSAAGSAGVAADASRTDNECDPTPVQGRSVCCHVGDRRCLTMDDCDWVNWIEKSKEPRDCQCIAPKRRGGSGKRWDSCQASSECDPGLTTDGKRLCCHLGDRRCLTRADCEWANWVENKTRECACISDSCFNGQKDQHEADVDCGLWCPNKCQKDLNCVGDGDCQSGKCIFDDDPDQPEFVDDEALGNMVRVHAKYEGKTWEVVVLSPHKLRGADYDAEQVAEKERRSTKFTSTWISEQVSKGNMRTWDLAGPDGVLVAMQTDLVVRDMQCTRASLFKTLNRRFYSFALSHRSQCPQAFDILETNGFTVEKKKLNYPAVRAPAKRRNSTGEQQQQQQQPQTPFPGIGEAKTPSPVIEEKPKLVALPHEALPPLSTLAVREEGEREREKEGGAPEVGRVPLGAPVPAEQNAPQQML
eukprot:m51a1_g1101 hypothetical protein (1114) ;mRNA; f:111446-117065